MKKKEESKKRERKKEVVVAAVAIYPAKFQLCFLEVRILFLRVDEVQYP
jgi:hypothetical protein